VSQLRLSRLTVSVMLLAAPTLRAQQTATDTAKLHPVVITATRVRVAQTAPTVATTVIDGDSLHARGITTVLDALKQVPDVVISQSGSYGSTTSLFMRGGESDYVQVLIDGVPVNDPGGQIDLANLTTDNVERIEVVRGPASVLYGSNAVTGVIQIFTRRGQGDARLDADARAGSFGTRDLEAALSRGGALGSLSLAGARHRTDGIYAFNSDYHNNVVSALARVTPDSVSDARLALRYTDADAGVATDFTGAVTDSNQFHTERRIVASLDAGHFFTRRLEGRVLVGGTRTDARSANQLDSPAESDFPYDVRSRVYRRSADGRVNFYLDPATALTVGAAYEWQRLRSQDVDDSRTNRAAYAQVVGGRSAVSYTVGGRVDRNDVFGTFATARIAAAYALPSGTRLRASFGTAFKEPTILETSSTGAFVVGNPNLRPERTRSWDAGVSQDLAQGHASLSATYFDQRFRDLIQYNPTPPSEGDPNYLNIARANASGVELELHLALANALSVVANYTFLRTRVLDAGVDAGPAANFVNGERLLRRPSHSGSVGVGYRLARRSSVHLDLTRVGDRVDIDFAQFVRVQAPAYTKVDLSAELGLLTAPRSASGVALTLRLDNALDEHYQSVYGFDAPGRALLVGARIGAGL
jgi:vitamin B12 transporter